MLTLLMLLGCDGGDKEMGSTSTVTEDGLRTLDSCVTTVGEGVPAFFSTFFKCVALTQEGDSTLISFNGLPPHRSPYYPDDDPNWVEFDTSNGRFQNPNAIAEQDLLVRIVADPVPLGLTISEAMVDEEAGDPEEFHAERTDGAVGVALDGVGYFHGVAAPGDLLSVEEETFDQYDAHPEMTGVYHHHGTNPAALAVLAAEGFTSSIEPGEADLEIYGIMCDGTVVLGCVEMDGSDPESDDLDAQNGHVHDLESDSGELWFAERYHVHACGDGRVPVRTYAPEVQYYTLCNRL